MKLNFYLFIEVSTLRMSDKRTDNFLLPPSYLTFIQKIFVQSIIFSTNKQQKLQNLETQGFLVLDNSSYHTLARAKKSKALEILPVSSSSLF